MTNYEAQIKRNEKYSEYIRWAIKTPKCLAWYVIKDGEKVFYFHEFDENGKCIDSYWRLIKEDAPL